MRSSSVLCLPAALLGILALAAPAHAQTCLKDHHEVKYPGGSAKLRDYLCRFGEGAGATRIRVTFHRLNEVMAGSIAKRERLAEFEAIAGMAGLVENDVSAELDVLYRDFALHAGEGDFKWSTEVETPPVSGAGPKGTQSGAMGGTNPSRSYWYLMPPVSGLGSDTIFIRSAYDTIIGTPGWPSGYKHFYDHCRDNEKKFIGCTVVWRYLVPEELDTIESDTADWERETAEQLERELAAVRAASGEPEPPPSEPEPPDTTYADYKRHFALFRHLSKRGWPADFVTVRGFFDECGGYAFQYFPRPLLVDVAVIENLSGTSVTIDDLIGARAAETPFRTPAQSEALRKSAGAALGAGPITLAPRERKIVPLRMLFADGSLQTATDEDGRRWGEMSRAQAAFKRIQALPEGSKLIEKLQTETVRKTRESFLAPSLPSRSEYVYGPEVALTGLIAGGVTARFEGSSANFVGMTAAREGGSCPHLYSWDGAGARWRRHGKVIHAAHERIRQETEVVPVKPGTLRFKLSEEEPEVSYIDGLELRLTLTGGRQVTLAPRQSELTAIDGRYLPILAYRSEIIEFALPADITGNMIETSELAITGYYRRYSTIGSELAARSQERAVMPVGLDAAAAGEASDRNR